MIKSLSTLYAAHVLEGEVVGFEQEGLVRWHAGRDHRRPERHRGEYPGVEQVMLGSPMGENKAQFKAQLTRIAKDVIPAFKSAAFSS